jgi:tight adherence protein B
MTELLAGLTLGGAALLLVLPNRRGRRRMAGIRTTPSSTAVRLVRWARRTVTRSTRTGAALAALLGGLVGATTAGPVAALVCGAYSGFGAYLMFRRRAAQRAGRLRAAALDAVTALADDLQAGLAPSQALGHVWPRLAGTDVEPLAAPGPVVPDDPAAVLATDAEPSRADITARPAVAWRLAAGTGAPLADLLDRLQTELSERERLRRTAAAQAAGNRVTAALLALLPLAGIGLGYAIGAHPLHLLWHTGIGAGCAVDALALQFAGVAWTLRLTRAGAAVPT